MNFRTLRFTTAVAGGLLWISPTNGFMAATTTSHRCFPSLAMDLQPGDEPLTTRSRYKMDVNALNQLLNAQEEEKLEEIRALVKSIQDTRKNNPEVALPHKVREALADYHRAQTEYGHDSREAKIAHEFFVDIFYAANMKPKHYYYDEQTTETETHHPSLILDAALDALNNLEELKEIAHMEKIILDRFGTTDFEIGEGFLERRIGKEDPDTYGLWP
ncbi:hypothetical protein ACHAWU_005844 [Discostella pseudostelligera]|uniref:Uncharacterized protein n=1 Tax=Discostella pseudostelligera TaxID=259834 RepID=A0ABD3LY21_9STRA